MPECSPERTVILMSTTQTLETQTLETQTFDTHTFDTQTFDTTTDRRATVLPALVKGWHEDPLGHHHLRYHDGNGWTEHVTHFGPVPCGSCR